MVAVSGGADSMCLLDVLHALSEDMGFTLVVGHVNHNLRPSANSEEALVRQWAKAYGLKCLAESVDVQSNGQGLESAARYARYQALSRMMKASGANKTATGHTATDQAETLLYRVLRGTGVRGLTGIQADNNGIIRPLLGISAHETRAYMQAMARPFLQDESNENTRFDRNFIRHEVMPLMERRFPGAAQRMAALARDMSGLRRFVEERSESLFQQAVFFQDNERLVLDLLPLHTIDEYWLTEVFAVVGRVVYGPSRPLSRQHINAMVRLVYSERPSGRLSLPGGLHVNRINGMLMIGQGGPPTFEAMDMKIGAARAGALLLECSLDAHPNMPAGLWTAIFPAASKDRMRIRPVHKGDRLSPLGMKGEKKVFRAIMDAKIPKFYRQSWPVVVVNDDVAWVPGVVRAGTWLYEQGRALRITIRVHDPVLKVFVGGL